MDGNDDLAQAYTRLRKAAASQLARNEAAEAEVARLERALRGLEAEPHEVEELREQLAHAQAQVESNAQELKASITALEEMKGLKASKERASLMAAVQDATPSDPLARTLEAVALAHAREAIENLDAQTRVMAELSGAAAPKVLSEAEKKARAEAELQRLKAARRLGHGSAEEAEGSPSETKKAKRTL